MPITDVEALKLASQIRTKFVRPLEHVADLVEYVDSQKRQVQEYEARIPVLKQEVEDEIGKREGIIKAIQDEAENERRELEKDHIKRKQDLEKEYISRKNILHQDYTSRMESYEKELVTFEKNAGIKKESLSVELNQMQIAVNSANAKHTQLMREIESKSKSFRDAELEMTEKIKQLNTEYAKLKEDYERFFSAITRRPTGG